MTLFACRMPAQAITPGAAVAEGCRDPRAERSCSVCETAALDLPRGGLSSDVSVLRRGGREVYGTTGVGRYRALLPLPVGSIAPAARAWRRRLRAIRA